MPLQSKLFRGDSKLEAAAVSDPAHIIPGASGQHVAKIQQALITLAQAAIEAGELQSSRYGPSTANAVLVYKQKRQIINRSYQTQADNIVGKMTIAALDKEMYENENKPPQTRSLRYCGCDYSTPPIAMHQAQVKYTIGRTVAGGDPVSSPSKVALSLVPEALSWLTKVNQALNVITGWSKPREELAGTVEFRALSTHFHCRLEDASDTAKQVRFKFWDITRLLGGAAKNGTFIDDNSGGPAADAYAACPTPRDGKIYFNPGFVDVGGKTGDVRTSILIHEAFHCPSDAHQDFGNPRRLLQVYRQVTRDIALNNAYSFSQFAIHIRFGRERILNDDGTDMPIN